MFDYILKITKNKSFVTKFTILIFWRYKSIVKYTYTSNQLQSRVEKNVKDWKYFV